MKSVFAIALLMISTLSFAECGMDTKLSILKELEEIAVTRAELLSESRSDKQTELKLKSLANRERDLIHQYQVDCNMN